MSSPRKLPIMAAIGAVPRSPDADLFLRRDAPVRFSNELVNSLQKNTHV